MSSLMAVLLIIGSVAVAAENTAVVKAVSGYVTKTSDNGEKKRLAPEDHLIDGNIITTGENSSVLLLLANGQTITLGPLASYTVGQKVVGNGISGGVGAVSSAAASPTLSTATSAGGGITPDDGGSPIN